MIPDPIDHRGPIETALSHPGFRRFWDTISADFTRMRSKLISEAEKHAKAGEVNSAHSCIVRSAQISDILALVAQAPARAIELEKEKSNVTSRPEPATFGSYDGL